MLTSTPKPLKVALALLTGLILPWGLRAQELPAVYSNLDADEKGLFIRTPEGKAYEIDRDPAYRLSQFALAARGTDNGLAFDFGAGLNGRLYYGFVPYGDSRHPQPVFFKYPAPIRNGKAEVRIKDRLSGKYDMIGWAEQGGGTLGYRVVDSSGTLLYDGRVHFLGKGPFTIGPTIIEGPVVSQPAPDGCVISFVTNRPVSAQVQVGPYTFPSAAPATRHEIPVSGLKPGRAYDYTVQLGDQTHTYRFRTAPEPGYKKAFTFAYASDSRNGQGGGERNLYGANAYIMKKIMALATQQGASFFQFSGDLIDGYLLHAEEMDLQYANWKRAVEPWTHQLPVYVGMGNHEALMRGFQLKDMRLVVDRFPFATESAEAIFARQFAMPKNGPASEDGAYYDPDPNAIDFPPYEENVFYYTYGNTAVVVLNSDYFYAPSTEAIPLTSGGVHAYIMDRQIDWLRQTIARLEADRKIRHIFVTQHTPCFPNGGHVDDDMWYRGNNEIRTYVSGKPLSKGILERRDEYLDILINQSKKVAAILTGDEHNYARTEVGPGMPMYPAGYTGPRLELKRTVWQINNGAAGAPYYAQELTPWSERVEGFTTQNALVLFHVRNKRIEVEVLNPDTLEEVDSFRLR